jgi:peptidoglycan hydrolase-like protein with peptidoglycan-binding domain
MESIAYQELALTWEASTELESFRLVKWEKLSAQGFLCFFSLWVVLSVLTAAAAALAQGFRGFPQVQGPTSFQGQTIQLPARGFFQQGDRSFAVTAIQQILQSLGYFNTTPSGFYGPITEGAVRRFQGDRGITTNGLVGQTTLSYLLGLVPPPQPPTIPSPPSNAILSFGDSGPEVGLVQQRLKNLGYYFGLINNFFDANTQQAVLQFQQANNITPNGRVGPTTRSFLFAGSGPSPFPSSPGPLPTFQLRRGDRGLSVRVLQNFLNGLGYQAGSVDGFFGSTTQLAVQRLQQDLGIVATGAIDESTLSTLRSYFNFPQLAPTPNSLTVSQLGQSSLGASPGGLTQNYASTSQVGYTVPNSNFANNPSQVLHIQRRLNLQGLYYGPFDGIYNPQMQQAIARAQQLYGVSPADILSRP